ncbi:MAG: phosphate ABC transporter permease PstA [Anaerolineae bacterium]|nr:phosphate ABC transporter permease PstA [Thermoflexales bacterium]HQW35218.1 phosphate ABC transporter permease PstA [Thermoflexales bacterium]
MKISQTSIRRRKTMNAVLLGSTLVATALATIPLIWIIVEVISRGLPALTPEFFTQSYMPLTRGGGGVLHAILGSFVLIGIASAISIPIALFAAIYAAQHPNTTLGLVIRFSTDVMSGLPSIVVGLFVYTLFVSGNGYSALAGGVALAIMMLPIVLRTTEEMLKLVPRAMREGSLGLGAPEWKTMFSVMLPAALSGILTGILLAVARVSGEAAPLLLTAQGSNFLSTSLGEPIAALPLVMFKYAIDPSPARNSQAWAIALVILAIVFALNLGARLLARNRH